MARKQKISKSNYFILGGPFAMSKYSNYFGDLRDKKLIDFMVQELINKISKRPETKKHLWHTHFKNTPTSENLKTLLIHEKQTKINHGTFILYELFAIEFYNIINKIKSGADINKIFEDEWLDVIYNFYADELANKSNSLEWLFDPDSIEVSDTFKNEVPKLIEGYLYYLNHITEDGSERKLCEYIENSVIKITLNVRQEIYNYNLYFDKMGNHINTILDNQFRISYLNCCAEPYLNT